MTTPGHRGRFDGFDVVSQQMHWDAVTRDVVLSRLAPAVDGPRFFTEAEAAVAGPLLDCLLGQEGEEPSVDLLVTVDRRLAEGTTDGWRYADMPEDGLAWRASLHALDAECRERFGCGFADAGPTQRLALVQEVQDRVDGQWHGLPGRRVWELWTRYACAAFYAHPWAWNEIGYGGPAYPRGYKNLGVDRREDWERPERDAADPVPWARRTEQARQAHLDRLGRS